MSCFASGKPWSEWHRQNLAQYMQHRKQKTAEKSTGASLIHQTLSSFWNAPSSDVDSLLPYLGLKRVGVCDSACQVWGFAGGQREELRPWQRSWGRRLGIRKGGIKPQETPCSPASTPKPESVLCSHLHLWLYGGLSPITISLGEGVNVQLQGNKNSWAWQECFSLWTPLKVI